MTLSCLCILDDSADIHHLFIFTNCATETASELVLNVLKHVHKLLARGSILLPRDAAEQYKQHFVNIKTPQHK